MNRHDARRLVNSLAKEGTRFTDAQADNTELQNDVWSVLCGKAVGRGLTVKAAVAEASRNLWRRLPDSRQ